MSASQQQNGTVEPLHGDRTAPLPKRREGERTRRFRRFGAGRDAAGGGNDASRGENVETLQAELMLLREENARLAQARHQPPGVAGLLRQIHAARAPEPITEDSADELTQLMVDFAVMRETLLLACDEMESSLSALRGRLAALPAGLVPEEPLPALNGNGSEEPLPALNGNGSAGAAAVLFGIDKEALP